MFFCRPAPPLKRVFSMSDDRITIKVTGMQCTGCEGVIEETVAELPGVGDVKADFEKGMMSVRFDRKRCSLDEICQAIEPKGYHCVLNRAQGRPAKPTRVVLSLLGLAAIAVLIYAARNLGHAHAMPELDARMSDTLVLMVGFVTGFHCVGMCGGFVLSYVNAAQESGRSPYLAHLFYGVGKTLSYTLFGALFGYLGALVSFTPMIRGVTAVVAGLFLLGFGLNMLGLLSWFRRVRIKQPEALEHLVEPVRRRGRHPLLIGLLTGLMFACGPLQAMYVMAAGTASPLDGAKIMFLFGVGTLPALLGFGLFASFLSGRILQHFFKISGILVISLGLIMVSKGLERTDAEVHIKTLWHQVQPYLSNRPR
jgi:sulfite exporter TauE/SafE/copper chaperone CopZ